MFVTPAYAQGAGAPGGLEIFIQIVPFILIFVIMYFLLIRPQQKRMKQHRDMVAAVRRGDVLCVPGWKYRVLNAGLQILPRSVVRAVAGSRSHSRQRT